MGLIGILWSSTILNHCHRVTGKNFILVFVEYILSRSCGFINPKHAQFLICLHLSICFYSLEICPFDLSDCLTTHAAAKPCSCCRISDAIICIYRLIALSKDLFKHVHYKCQSYLCAVVSSRGRDYLLYKMAQAVITRFHGCWLHQAGLYKAMIGFNTFKDILAYSNLGFPLSKG